MEKDLTLIRNFCIVAHIDHGKSTLADRLIEYTHTLEKRDLSNQTLDSMDLERERGITIKLSPVKMNYTFEGKTYELNLIDTPGHVDFTYEVSRSLKACDGAILLIDATQGVEAQTLANLYLAVENNLEILPVINKIDLPSANIEETKKQIEQIIGLPSDNVPCISAKNGINIDEVLKSIITSFPCPKGDINEPLKALVFDSFYDAYKGAICLVSIKDGCVTSGDRIKMFEGGSEFDVTEVGVFKPNMQPVGELSAGDVGYVAASIKNVRDARVGDTITNANTPCLEAVPGYKKVQPVVFSGIYPVEGDKYADLKEALEKLQLSDASLEYQLETSAALGFGFRVGFLGLLHMEIIIERLEREFNLDIISTSPSVNYLVHKVGGEVIEVSNPSNMPPPASIDFIEEPIVNLFVYSPPDYVGDIMDLCIEKRGVYKDLIYLEEKRVKLNFIMPLSEIVFDFFDALKSRTKGYASLEYELCGYQKSPLVKVDILLNGEQCDALSQICHRDKAYQKSASIVAKLKEVIPRQMFEVPIQAAIGGKIIARETIKALRKDVLAKCYGGDITRKRKLLEKQKEGKKRMRKFGNVEVPSEAFTSILKLDNN